MGWATQQAGPAGLIMNNKLESNIPKLSVVMPAYNEEASIRFVLEDWIEELDRLQIDYEILAYDDGSSDATGRLLETLSRENPRIQARSHANIGHGPTILQGYHEARGQWVFQVDADGEMSPAGFEALWEVRSDHDFLFGYRSGRHSDWGRMAITQASRWTVWVLFGKAVRDVNTPYRLMRQSCLEVMLELLPDDTFAPNVVLSGLAIRGRLRIAEQPVVHQGRPAGQVSLGGWQLWMSALRSLVQTLRIAFQSSKKS